MKREKDKKFLRWLELKKKCSNVFDIEDMLFDIKQEIEETK